MVLRVLISLLKYMILGCDMEYILQKFLSARSIDEDLKRREFILNTLLVSSVLLSVTSFLYSLTLNVINHNKGHQGVSLTIQAFIMAVFCSLYAYSRAGFFIRAAYVFVGLYFLSATYALYRFGADLPQGLLVYTLIIVLAGILVGTKFAYFTTFLISLTLSILTYLQLKSVVIPKFYWRSEVFSIGDIIVFISTFSVIAVVSWLSNREMEAALKRARQSESDLKKERDSLEIRVEERTVELKKAQMEKMLQLYQFSEFGRISAGLIHDFINPLTALSLNLEQASCEMQSKSVASVKRYIEQASIATKRMEDYVRIARKQLQHQDVSDEFHPTDEIRQVCRMLSGKAGAAGVTLKVIGLDKTMLFGNFIRFSQVMANVIANAIDAYQDCDSEKKEVNIRVSVKKNGDMTISVQDWGCGIKKEDAAAVFDPFFTTKGYENGTGIGLFVVKQIIEGDFHGQVSLSSEVDFGTICLMTFPKSYDKSNEKSA